MRGYEQVAAYCDEQNEKHVFSAVCPHMGCLINWNPIEKTFDCPCAFPSPSFIGGKGPGAGEGEANSFSTNVSDYRPALAFWHMVQFV